MTSARGSGVWQSGDGAMVRLDGIFIRQHVASSPRQQPSPAHRRNRAVWPSSPRRPPPALRGSRDQTRRPEAPGRPVVRCCLNAAGSGRANGHPQRTRIIFAPICAGKKVHGHSGALCCAHSGALEAASDSAASELRCFSGAPGRIGGAREPVWMRLDGGKLKGWEVVCGGYEGRL